MDKPFDDAYPCTTPAPLTAPRGSTAASTPRPAPRVPSAGGERLFWFVVELFASGSTLAGMYVGSTTAMGASLYLLSLVFWFAITFKRRLWGLMPLNVASTFVAGLNMWRAMHPVVAGVIVG